MMNKIMMTEMKDITVKTMGNTWMTKTKATIKMKTTQRKAHQKWMMKKTSSRKSRNNSAKKKRRRKRRKR